MGIGGSKRKEIKDEEKTKCKGGTTKRLLELTEELGETAKRLL